LGKEEAKYCNSKTQIKCHSGHDTSMVYRELYSSEHGVKQYQHFGVYIYYVQ